MGWLFDGRPPPSTTTYGTKQENVPQWMSDFTQGLVTRADAIAGENYQPYQGPRIAGFNPDQTEAFQATRENVGASKGALNSAKSMLESTSNVNPLNAAKPYFKKADQSFTGSVDKYMSPYIQNVLNRQQSLSNRNLKENVLPAIQDAFTGSGQFGSTRMMEMANRGARDIAENLQEQQLGALHQAYGQAGDLFNSDQNRTLSIGQSAGDLEAARAEIALNAANSMSGVADQIQGHGLRDAAALEAIGKQQQALDQSSLDLGYSDYERQLNYPKEQAGWLSNIIRGHQDNVGGTTQTSSTGPASTYQPSGLSQLIGAYSAYKGATS